MRRRSGLASACFLQYECSERRMPRIDSHSIAPSFMRAAREARSPLGRGMGDSCLRADGGGTGAKKPERRLDVRQRWSPRVGAIIFAWASHRGEERFTPWIARWLCFPALRRHASFGNGVYRAPGVWSGPDAAGLWRCRPGTRGDKRGVAVSSRRSSLATRFAAARTVMQPAFSRS